MALIAAYIQLFVMFVIPPILWIGLTRVWRVSWRVVGLGCLTWLTALPFIEKSLEMGDLTDAQRQELTSLHQRYRDEYVSYCRKMVPKRESLPEETDEQSRTEFWKRRMAEQNEQAKIRFDRDERSQRAVSQLRRILTAEQAARIGALASYDHDAAGNGAMPSDAAPD